MSDHKVHAGRLSACMYYCYCKYMNIIKASGSEDTNILTCRQELCFCTCWRLFYKADFRPSVYAFFKSCRFCRIHVVTTFNLRSVQLGIAQVDNGARDALMAGRAVFQCTACTAVFTSSLALRSHVNGVHLRVKASRCPDCGESFTWRSGLFRHRRRGECPVWRAGGGGGGQMEPPEGT
jgi:uncharacterized C2H2 Zn-finger protein